MAPYNVMGPTAALDGSGRVFLITGQGTVFKAIPANGMTMEEHRQAALDHADAENRFFGSTEPARCTPYVLYP